MFFRSVLFLSSALVAFDAYADEGEVLRVTPNSAYQIENISKSEYEGDTTGNVFVEYKRTAIGEVVPAYYRYQFNTDKNYAEIITKNELGGGDAEVENEGDIATVSVGLGVNNTESMNSVGDILYKDNTYDYEYTGEGNGNVLIRGAVVYNEGTIGAKNLQGEFEGDAVNADFVGNRITADSDIENNPLVLHVEGGVLSNTGDIGLISSDFINNAVVSDVVDGGVVYNGDNRYIRGFDGDFVGNKGTAENVKGGVILNLGQIDAIKSDFIGNTMTASVQANGAAIQNNDAGARIRSISGSFIDNKAMSKLEAWGGAIDNVEGTIDEISGAYNNNLAEARGENTLAVGGAISNAGVIGKISGDFVGNRAVADGEAYGGAIYHDGSTSKADALKIVNSNFYNNSAEAPDGAVGGAIYGNYIQILADGQRSEFRGNTANGESNAVFIEGDVRKDGALILSAQKGGQVVFDDDIDGWRYDVDIEGDGAAGSEVMFNSRVEDVRHLNLTDKAVMRLGTTADINTVNYTVADGSMMKLDVNVDRDNNKIDNGVMHVSGDIQGKTTVIVNSLNRDKLAHVEDAHTMFVEAAYDDPSTYSEFEVGRVISSPYIWEAVKNYNGETGDTVSNWYLVAKDGDVYTPEIPAYVAMQSAVIEQNRGMNRKIADGLRANRNRGCCDRKFAPKREAWIDADYAYAEIDAPSEMDAKIKGVTAGFDVAADMYNRLGLFGSYRQGDYDLSGKGKYRSSIGSSMDIDSYLGGLYYAYNRGPWSALATVFAGTQDINVKTDDHLAKADTSAMQYGASLEFARQFYLPYAWIMEPSLGLYYTAVDLDGFTDNVGKTVDFDLLHYMEAELGLRFEHLFCNNGWTSKVYVKPSVIQTFASDARTKITGLRQVDTYENKTLGRMEIGAKLGLTPALSAYTSANYTFGRDYQSYGVDAGLTYAW